MEKEKVLVPNKKSHECKFQCGSSFRLLSSKRRHEETCNKNVLRRRKFACDVCNKTFSLKSSLGKHKTAIHGSKESKKFKCLVCGKAFNFKDRLKTHLKYVHSKVRPIACKFECEHCQKRFASKGSLQRHYEVHGTIDDKIFNCISCGKIFMSQSKLTQHRKVHLKVTPYICQHGCGSSFKSQGYKSKHELSCILNKNRELHPCPVCDKVLAHKSSLYKHKITVHDMTVNDKKFQCEICGKRFNFKDRLKTHYLVHSSNEKAFECKHGCGSTFKYNHSKVKHEVKCSRMNSITKSDVNGNKIEEALENRKIQKSSIEEKIGIVEDHWNEDEEEHDSEFDNYLECEVCFQSFTNIKALSRHSECHYDNLDHSIGTEYQESWGKAALRMRKKGDGKTSEIECESKIATKLHLNETSSNSKNLGNIHGIMKEISCVTLPVPPNIHWTEEDDGLIEFILPDDPHTDNIDIDLVASQILCDNMKVELHVCNK